MKHGMQGIGIYWCVVEMLYEEGGYLPLEYERISFELRTDTKVIQDVIQGFELFNYDDKSFWSETVLERLKERCEKSEKARESINKRWSKHSDTNVLRKNVGRNTKKSRVKESKVKNKYIDSVFLSDDEYRKLIEKFTQPVLTRCIEVLNNYKMSSGKKYKSDYHTICGWVIRRVQEDGKNGGSNNPRGQRPPIAKTGAKSDGVEYPLDGEY